VVASILRPGTAAPEPIAWEEVGERVLAPQWMGLQRRTAGCVDGATIASLPALAADGERIGASAVAALGGDGTTPEQARRMAADVLAASLALALRGAGWAVKSRPGAPVELRRGDARLEPFREVARLVQGERTASSWRGLHSPGLRGPAARRRARDAGRGRAGRGRPGRGRPAN
jgi:hypothetical protein